MGSQTWLDFKDVHHSVSGGKEGNSIYGVMQQYR